MTSNRVATAVLYILYRNWRQFGFATLGCTFLVSVPIVSRAVRAGEPQLEEITFQSSDEDFVNPERGFLHFRDLTSPHGYDTVRSQGHSLIYGRILAEDFRNGPLSQSFLNQIQAGFDAARANGIKVKPRVAYNDDGGADAPKSVILNHIQQLKPLFEANKDVIYVMDAGFIGGWGEWHSSTNGLDNNTDRTEILTALLDALPVDRMVGIRTPHFKREIFNGSPLDDTLKITAETAFNGSDLSRVGHLNDCFLASGTDFGTYIYQSQGWSREAELEYIGGESRYAPHGGETCNCSIFSTGTNAIYEMAELHTDYLNFDYHPDVIQEWRDDGSFDEISKRLGYRFELQTASLPAAVKPSGILELKFTIDNVGFGELFNPRNVEVTMEDNSTGEITAASLQIDPRFWSGGTTSGVHAFLAIPSDMREGQYSVGLRMPDIEESLHDDVRYAIRFANQDVWDAATGINVLKTDLTISQTAEGAHYLVGTEFREIDPNTLQLAGDFDADRDVDGDDLLIWQRAYGIVYDDADLAEWQANFGAILTSPASASVVPEPATHCFLIGTLLIGFPYVRLRKTRSTGGLRPSPGTPQPGALEHVL